MRVRKLSARSLRTRLNLERLDDRITPALGLGVLVHGNGAMAVALHNPHVAVEVSTIDIQIVSSAPAGANGSAVAAETSVSFTLMVSRGGSIEIVDVSTTSTNDVSTALNKADTATTTSVSPTTSTPATTHPDTTTPTTAAPVSTESARAQL